MVVGRYLGISILGGSVGSRCQILQLKVAYLQIWDLSAVGPFIGCR